MKTKKILSLILSIVFIATLGIPVLAVESRESAQIAVYGMDVTPISGELAVDFSITGSGRMEKIGCESIYIYKLVDSRWVLTDSQTENDTGMSKTSKVAHGNTISFAGTAGTEYMVVVTVFAEDDAARDTRSQTFYVTGK